MKQFQLLCKTQRWLCLVLLLLVTASLGAQIRTITGKAISSEGEPLIGATVLVANSTDRGTVTDFDGSFTIQAKTGEEVYFSYTGYTTKVVKVGGENTLDVVLETASEILDEIVVIGYGAQKKSDLTGAVSFRDQ